MDNLKTSYLKYRFILWPALTVIASVTIIALVIVPQLLSYLNIKTQIYNTESRSKNLEVKAQVLKQINEADIQQKLRTVLSVLPADPEVVQAMTAVQNQISKQTAAGHQLILKDASYVAPGLGNKDFQIKITVLGQLDSVRGFLIGLETSPRLMEVQSIKAHFQSDGIGTETNIPLSVFFEPTSTANISIDQDVPKLSSDDEKKLAQLSANVSVPLIATQFPIKSPGSPGPTVAPVPSGVITPPAGFPVSPSGAPPAIDLNVDVSSVQLGKDDPFQ